MPTIVLIKVNGLAEFRRDLRTIDRGLGTVLRKALNEVAEVVLERARPEVPVLTGRAKKSLKAKSTQTEVRVQGGGTRVPYYPWLDFGGRRRGRGGGIAERRFYGDGRILYHSYYQVRDSGEFEAQLTKSLVEVARQAGVQVDGGQ